jgi:hypothetical protein
MRERSAARQPRRLCGPEEGAYRRRYLGSHRVRQRATRILFPWYSEEALVVIFCWHGNTRSALCLDIFHFIYKTVLTYRFGAWYGITYGAALEGIGDDRKFTTFAIH